MRCILTLLRLAAVAFVAACAFAFSLPTAYAGSLEIDVRPVEITELDSQTSEASPKLPDYDEYLMAIDVLRADPHFAPLLASGRLVPYQAMPLVFPPGQYAGHRVLPIGLRPATPDALHEIVAVDLTRRTIERFVRRSPPDSIATAHTCGPPPAGQGVTKVGTAGSVEIVVRQNGVELWRMKATRPAASGGPNGSGVELREIRYRERLVLHRVHAPILNVDYVGNVCGPYRDAVNFESAFNVEGTAIGPGFVKTPTPPQTIFETKVDQGNFWGVAVYEDSDELVLMSELSAGWYRYASEFRFSPDGTIRPLFKFDAVQNSCTCQAHDHHVYWRFDFDVDGAANSAQALGTDGWRSIAREVKFTRGPEDQAWRIVGEGGRRIFEVTPGPYDGTTNAFGNGDGWFLRYHTGEIDDSKLGTSKDAKLDSFVGDEALSGSDLVFWYAGHIRHSQDTEESPHIAGPVIRMVQNR